MTASVQPADALTFSEGPVQGNRHAPGGLPSVRCGAGIGARTWSEQFGWSGVIASCVSGAYDHRHLPVLAWVELRACITMIGGMSAHMHMATRGANHATTIEAPNTEAICRLNRIILAG